VGCGGGCGVGVAAAVGNTAAAVEAMFERHEVASPPFTLVQ
jgi:hypothetical protein